MNVVGRIQRLSSTFPFMLWIAYGEVQDQELRDTQANNQQDNGLMTTRNRILPPTSECVMGLRVSDVTVFPSRHSDFSLVKSELESQQWNMESQSGWSWQDNLEIGLLYLIRLSGNYLKAFYILSWLEYVIWSVPRLLVLLIRMFG